MHMQRFSGDKGTHLNMGIFPATFRERRKTLTSSMHNTVNGRLIQSDAATKRK